MSSRLKKNPFIRINGVHLFRRWEGGMTTEAQGAARSQQLSLGVDGERLQGQRDSGIDLPTDMQKDITEPDLRFFISTLKK